MNHSTLSGCNHFSNIYWVEVIEIKQREPNFNLKPGNSFLHRVTVKEKWAFWFLQLESDWLISTSTQTKDLQFHYLGTPVAEGIIFKYQYFSSHPLIANVSFVCQFHQKRREACFLCNYLRSKFLVWVWLEPSWHQRVHIDQFFEKKGELPKLMIEFQATHQLTQNISDKLIKSLLTSFYLGSCSDLSQFLVNWVDTHSNSSRLN